jgi:thioredoxin-related protein
MKTIRLLFYIAPVFASANLYAQNDPVPVKPTAIEVLNKATAQAAAENKKVLLIFHASWCVWCRRMDSSLNDISCKKFFDDNFVITHITVMESPQKKNLEHAGGEELMKKYNEKARGLPNWVMLDKEGELLFDSQMKVLQTDSSYKFKDIGCPANLAEVDSFIEILKKLTTLTEPQLAIIEKRFRQNEKKQ